MSFRVDNRSGADRKPGSGASPWEELFIVYNGSEEDFVVGLPEDGMWAEESPGLEDGPGPGRWEILADGLEADCRRQVELPEGAVRVAARSGMLLGKTGAGEGAAS